MLLSINSQNPQMRLVRKAVECLRDGGVIIYPTDTVYGLGCDLFNKRGIEKIYDIKKRSKKDPLSFVCADLKDISRYALVSDYAYKTMRRLLPGPYTFYPPGLEAGTENYPSQETDKRIRVPDHPICQALVQELGQPIISTSVKTAQGELLNDPYIIREHFSHCVDIIIDGGIIPAEPSSVISLADDQIEILRVGKGDVSAFQ
jgi:tRNA threonylcarbamoyl adenosine modification protein (Sua5/YciO/YrdC/YwlC family)